MYSYPMTVQEQVEQLDITLNAIDSERLAAMRDLIESVNYCYKSNGFFESELCSDAIIHNEINSILMDRMIYGTNF